MPNRQWDIAYHRGITVEDLERCFNAKDIREDDAIIHGTGWAAAGSILLSQFAVTCGAPARAIIIEETDD